MTLGITMNYCIYRVCVLLLSRCVLEYGLELFTMTSVCNTKPIISIPVHITVFKNTGLALITRRIGGVIDAQLLLFFFSG